jgi:hypothetical protein
MIKLVGVSSELNPEKPGLVRAVDVWCRFLKLKNV